MDSCTVGVAVLLTDPCPSMAAILIPCDPRVFCTFRRARVVERASADGRFHTKLDGDLRPIASRRVGLGRLADVARWSNPVTKQWCAVELMIYFV